MARKIPRLLRILLYLFYSVFLWQGSRPRSCYRRQRAVEPHFGDSEHVFFHLFSNDIQPDGTFGPAAMQLPDFSVNRSGFGGRSWFVLLPQPGDELSRAIKRLFKGIVSIRACDINIDRSEAGKLYTFRVEHAPDEHNFHHCEIRAYGDGSRLTKKAMSKSTPSIVKKYYRHKLSGKATFVLLPTVSAKNAK